MINEGKLKGSSPQWAGEKEAKGEEAEKQIQRHWEDSIAGSE